MAVKHLKTEEFEAVVEAAPLAMVDFWADWCGPCKMLSPTIEALAEQYEGKALVAKINVDEEPELARTFGVMSTAGRDTMSWLTVNLVYSSVRNTMCLIFVMSTEPRRRPPLSSTGMNTVWLRLRTFTSLPNGMSGATLR